MYRLYKDTAEVNLTAEQINDKKIISSMISDIEFTLEWLQNGRQPGARRGADRRDAYQRTILADPRLIDALQEEYVIVQEVDGEVSDWDKERIADALFKSGRLLVSCCPNFKRVRWRLSIQFE
ncbi:hypothetical protein [Bacillus siamensis]|uniref:hypothetical protein n=1 Tax=Bacillus siamensis TaxID=659243 RepID=UPI002E22D50F|nr:hypothetical protein [Bacillus siamensis]MED0776221.1 hypothetical protein [Bacillus siamensis]MED0778398.1 hypothetical protein [Bacillus siamensis]MED0835255.1 hypothetical protein [Bacillus siamensis]